MVIYDSERFGLATLHQLRGRIGRNSLESTCVLIGSEKNERLKVMCESNDGFYITERDFEMRGEGDLFGVRQSGDMSFKVVNLKADYKILLQVKDDVKEFVKSKDYLNYDCYKEFIHSLENVD